MFMNKCSFAVQQIIILAPTYIISFNRIDVHIYLFILLFIIL